MHLPPAQRGPPRRAAGAAGQQRPGTSPVVVAVLTTAPTAGGVASAAAPPPPPTRQQLPPQRPSAPEHAPAVSPAARPQKQQPQPPLDPTTTTMASPPAEAPPAATAAAPSPLSSFDQQETAPPPPAIIAPLRVRRRVKRPDSQQQQHQQHNHHTDRRRLPARQQQSPPQQHQNNHNRIPALLATLAIATGAIATYYAAPPAAFAAGGIAAAGGGSGGPAAASLVAAAAAASAAAASLPPSNTAASGPPVRLLAVIGAGPNARSPYSYSAPTADSLRRGGQSGAAAAPTLPPPPLWSEVAPHLAYRLELSNPRFQLEVLREEDVIEAFSQGGETEANAVLAKALDGSADSNEKVVAIVAMGPLADPRTADLLSSPSSAASSVGTLLSIPTTTNPPLIQRAGFYSPQTANPLRRLLARNVPFSPQARAAKLLRDTQLLLSRHTSDDAVFAFLSVIHAYGGVSVPDVANAAQGGPDLNLLICVFTHCREPVLNCVNDPQCKATLDCLSNVPPNDQVASYRCIVAGESKLFTEFTKCVVLKHNCRGLTATTPTEPNPSPMREFHGKGLMTHELAEAILFGHGVDPTAAPSSAKSVALVPGTRPWAWRIAGGKNAAFDRFPAQHQLFYRTGSAAPGSKGGAVWYVPIFAVAPDGVLLKEKVWRDRKYRVRRDEGSNDQPGRFLFTVSDNGATSVENWTLLDADDYSGGLEWALFYYRGSAPEAGMAYSGAVLGTRDGEWPGGLQSAERIEAALRSAGIEPWELTRVDNSDEAVSGAPLLPHGGWGSGGGGGGAAAMASA